MCITLLLCVGCVTPVQRPNGIPVTPISTLPPLVPTFPPLTPTGAPLPTPSPTPTAADLLDILSPMDGDQVQANGVVVHGFAAADADVQVNSQPVQLGENGRFSQEVELSPGVNTILVVAETASGRRVSKALNVISLLLPPQPLFLLVTQPENQSVYTHPDIPIVGRTTPGTVVKVNGVTVPVDAAGVFTTVLTLDPGPNIIDVEALGMEGDALNAVRAVIYRP